MKFELTDDAVLKISALGHAAVAAHSVFAPRDFQVILTQQAFSCSADTWLLTFRPPS